MKKPIYLDYNATTPVDPRVAEAMLPYLSEHFGNPSSGHVYGVATRQAVDHARQQVAASLGCRTDEVIFTSGGSEANNLAIKGVAAARRDQGRHIITSQVEHPAVSEVCRHLESEGFRVSYLPVDGHGQVDPATVAEAMSDETILVTIMHANNEVGTMEPIRAIADLAHQRGAVVHSDCAQSVGKVPVRVDELGVDLLSVAGHKLYAPKGIGALYLRGGLVLEQQIHGASHEQGRRAGTENVLEIVGLGEACALVSEALPEISAQLATLRERLETGLREQTTDLRVNGHPTDRLPNTLSVSWRGLQGPALLAALPGIAASAGAACHGSTVEISSVLRAMGVDEEYALGTIRLSVGRHTTPAEIDAAVEQIAAAVNRLQRR